MPFTDPLSSISGRNSRASNVSGVTTASRPARSPPPHNDTLVNAGVLSMLKTSTDTGDIGALSFNSTRLPSMPRQTHQRRGHASRPSISAHYVTGPASNHSYAPSQTSRVSSQWDAGSATQRRGSLTSMQSMPPSLPPIQSNKPKFAMVPPHLDSHADPRAYSLTSAAPLASLPRHRSATSLRSQEHEPRRVHRIPPRPVPEIPESRPVLVYPTRLKRPGYRSPSPALSDFYASGALPAPPSAPARAQMRLATGPSPQPDQPCPVYSTEYPGAIPRDTRHLNVRPPTRTANSAPSVHTSAQYGFRPSPLGVPVTPGIHQPMMAPAQYPLPSRGPPPSSAYGPSRSPYVPYAHIPYSGQRGQPPTNVGPVAHQVFHNAARMVRQLPHRTDTPMTDISPPSSDPPSSSSAPTSSNPPTPKDHATIQVMIDPAFINPELVDLPDSSSEPVIPAKYFAYADSLEKPFHETGMDVPHPSVPPSGFVQRVKAMLESKAAAEAAASRQEHEKGADSDHVHELENGHDSDISELADNHELAANETPRFTIIEEFEAPVELPASPVKIAELEAVELMQHQSPRITREMVKAELSPSSVDNTIQYIQSDDTTTHLILGHQEMHEAQNSQSSSAEEHESNGDAHSSGSSQGPSDRSPTEGLHESARRTSETTSLPTVATYEMQFPEETEAAIAHEETRSKPLSMICTNVVTLEPSTKWDQAAKPIDVQSSIMPTPTNESGQGAQVSSGKVSPLRTGEDIKRTSAVSPMQTEITLGIDETLHLASEPQSEASDGDSSFPESSQPTDSYYRPISHMAKQYSKSVQLQPHVAFTDSSSSGTHRQSLPGDLSTLVDTTVNSASDMVTDIAVRFSLPTVSASAGAPQIIDISNHSTPEKSPLGDTVHQQQLPSPDLRSTRRCSVTFADEIAPLNVSKKQTQRHPISSSTETATSKGKFALQKVSPQANIGESKTRFRESTSELRFPNNNNLNGVDVRFGSTRLPELKEESIEDMSISENKRTSEPEQFLLPARIAAVKAMQERRLQESADKAKARRQARQHNQPLAKTRDLPSLNFSRVDLIDRLNEALETRATRSVDVVRRRECSNIYCPSPQRPQSTEPLRERYMSFFCKPEDLGFPNEDITDDEDDPVSKPEKALVPTLQIQKRTEIEDVESVKRSLSPEDFLNVASQVQRLSIPNVTILSERLSELIPGLRNLSHFQLDSIFSSDPRSLFAIQSNELARPDTVVTCRTSAGFRTLAERAEEIVQNGTHDSMAPAGRLLSNDLPTLPGSASVDKLSKIGCSEGKRSYLSGSISAPVDLGKEPARPRSALLRPRAPTTEEEVQRMLPKEMNPIARNALRPKLASHPTSRPWNIDENYPWSGSEVEVDLSVPSAAHTRSSGPSEPTRRETISLDSTRYGASPGSPQGIEIGSIKTEHLDSSASITTKKATGIVTQHSRVHPKRSIIGSLSRKLGLSDRGTADEKTSSEGFIESPLLLQRSSTRQSHKPGDRYPTSSLAAPAGFDLDEVRSYFSDNSSERDRTTSSHKRLAKAKGRKLVQPEDAARGGSFNGDTAYDAGVLVDDARLGGHSGAQTYDGVGMSKTEFHIKRFGEKLRLLLAKGGELIRSLSNRRGRTQEHMQDEWLADSVYSGV